MSGIGEAFSALKNVMLLHERMGVLQEEMSQLGQSQVAMTASVAAIDRRLARLEGFVEGATAANATRHTVPKRIEE